jgi:putative acetyltransferase
VTVRPETPADHDEIRALVTLAMGPAEAELVDLVRGSPHYVPGLALVAEDTEDAEHPGPIVGYGMFSHVDVEGMAPGRILALAPLCVRPDRQHRGVGGALVRAGLERAEAAGEAAVIVLGDPRYYGRFGFEPARRLGLEPPPGTAEEPFQARRLSGSSERFGGRVVYPPAFAVVD